MRFFEFIKKFFSILIYLIYRCDSLTNSYRYYRNIREINIDPKKDGFCEHCFCEHDSKPHDFDVVVLGSICRINSSTMCETCTSKYLNRFSTICASCKRPIFPGTHVARSKVAEHEFTHLSFDCCQSGALYCGKWVGRLITLDELNSMNQINNSIDLSN